jgi:hypothetical protein
MAYRHRARRYLQNRPFIHPKRLRLHACAAAIRTSQEQAMPHIKSARSTLGRTALCAAGVFLVAGCSGLTSENSSINPSYLSYTNMTGTLTVPDTVTHGTLFTVQIQTIGGGCTQEAAGTDVTVNGQTVEIRPSDRTVVRNDCPSNLIYINHTANAQVPAAGVATIKVIGITDAPAAGATSNQYIIRRDVVVR